MELLSLVRETVSLHAETLNRRAESLSLHTETSSLHMETVNLDTETPSSDTETSYLDAENKADAENFPNAGDTTGLLLPYFPAFISIPCNGFHPFLIKIYHRMERQALVTACLNGDAHAHKQLYDAFAAQMMGVCYRYTKSVEDAEDVLQEGFIKVFLHLKQFDSRGELGGWIRRIMVNTALASLKKNTVYSSEMLMQEEHLHLVSDDNPEITLNTKQLVELIRQLPPGYQTIFNLYAIDGFSHGEIGKMLGISEGTSRSQYMRARTILINWLRKQPGEHKTSSYA